MSERERPRHQPKRKAQMHQQRQSQKRGSLLNFSKSSAPMRSRALSTVRNFSNRASAASPPEWQSTWPDTAPSASSME